MDHFNTTHLKGEQLKKANEEAKTIYNKVLVLYKELGEANSSLIYRRLNGKYRVESIRARISTMVKRGILEMTTEMRPSIYGKSEHVYKLV